MKILYGVQGTGNGHITRARALGPTLQARGIEVDFIFSGREPSKYFNMEPFGQYRTFAGFTFVTDAGVVKQWQTVRQAKPLTFLKNVKALNVTDYDLVISDFEPISAWAAKLRGVKSIGIAHQYAFIHQVPGKNRSSLIGSAIKLFAPVRKPVGLHWSSFNQPILPPMIARQNQRSQFNPRQILVYLPFEELTRTVEFLKLWSSYDFHLFADVGQRETISNVTLNPLSRKAFKASMLSCAGVFTSAGFGVCSEAIQAGKALMVKPLKGQFEQLANADALEALQYGQQIEGFDEIKFEQWLSSLAPSPVKPWPDTAALLADWIAAGCDEPLENLSQRAWNGSYPADFAAIEPQY